MAPTARRPLVIANWKMNLTASRAAAHARDLVTLLSGAPDREIAVAPSFTALPAVAGEIQGSHLRLAAQDISSEDEGPYTGEVSGAMLQELGVLYVLVGHSERRLHLGETDLMVARKVRAALRADLRPVVCVGEQESARASGRAAAVVRSQLLRAIEDVPRGDAGRLVIAYEPVWAIGTRHAATPADARDMEALIRREALRLLGEEARGIRVLYGGSVTPDNIDAFMAGPGIDGALVGTASLRSEEFARIAAFRRRA